MNRRVGIFNAIYKPESCKMKCSLHSTTMAPIAMESACDDNRLSYTNSMQEKKNTEKTNH